MHCHQNLVGRQWTVKVRLSDGPDAASPRNLAGYRALCLTKKPPNIDCFVEIARPKDLGVVQVVFLEQTDHQTLHEERIHCEINLQDLSGTIEKVASFSLDIA